MSAVATQTARKTASKPDPNQSAVCANSARHSSRRERSIGSISVNSTPRPGSGVYQAGKVLHGILRPSLDTGPWPGMRGPGSLKFGPCGTVLNLAFSPAPEQKFVFIADAANDKVGSSIAKKARRFARSAITAAWPDSSISSTESPRIHMGTFTPAKWRNANGSKNLCPSTERASVSCVSPLKNLDQKFRARRPAQRAETAETASGYLLGEVSGITEGFRN
jgi:hypothetical protein